jgi:hypothetical protein
VYNTFFCYRFDNFLKGIKSTTKNVWQKQKAKQQKQKK